MLTTTCRALDPRDLAPNEFLQRANALGALNDSARRLMSRVTRRGIIARAELSRAHRVPRILCDAMGELQAEQPGLC